MRTDNPLRPSPPCPGSDKQKILVTTWIRRLPLLIFHDIAYYPPRNRLTRRKTLQIWRKSSPDRVNFPGSWRFHRRTQVIPTCCTLNPPAPRQTCKAPAWQPTRGWRQHSTRLPLVPAPSRPRALSSLTRARAHPVRSPGHATAHRICLACRQTPCDFISAISGNIQ